MIDEILRDLEDKRIAAHKAIDDFYDNPPKKRKYIKRVSDSVYNTSPERRKPYVHSERYYKARREMNG